ncbi:uncharacterized protein LOC134838143 [Culicoides brevitarsis]|uniref:uncharacterized protein LOC134838143 n=1 Tax=Culicoides brevitarsis TaxID=469753 RepID=UPI00307C4DA2
MRKLLTFIAFFAFSFDFLNAGNTGIFFEETDLILPQGTGNSKRKPISKPDICGDDELLYPGDLDDDWVCDCRPAFVYHPDYDRCYALHRQGPCQSGEHLVLKNGTKVPQCERNTCRRDNEVKFKGRCHTLGKRGPCQNIFTAEVVEVNETTLELGCVKTRIFPVQLNTRFTDTFEINGCKKGTKKLQKICEKRNVQFWLAPEMCGENKLLYKLPNEDERHCDCKTGFIYHNETDSCYQAHLQGPCSKGQVFVLENDVGVCKPSTSSCKGPKEVKFNKKCVEIGSTGSCTNGAIVGVNAETYEIDCVAPLEESKPGTVLDSVSNCPKGNKRNMENKC